MVSINERARANNKDTPVGFIYPPIPRLAQRSSPRSRDSRNNHLENNCVENFFDNLQNILINDLKNTFYFIRTMLNRMKKKILKQIASEILQRGNQVTFDAKSEQYYLYILDIIDTKLYKPKLSAPRKSAPKHICTVNFDNKSIEAISLSQILNHPDIVMALPCDLRDKDSIPVVTYKLGGTIRNKILNYKETVNSISVDEEVSFCLNTDTCDCAESEFCDPHHKHIITGDLRLIKNSKLRKLMTKGPNYREPRTINFSKALTEIKCAINACIETLASKTKHSIATFNNWKDSVLTRVQQKINTLKNRLKPEKTKPTLHDPEVKTYLELLHRRFVVVPIDKAANNFAFVCKRFYISQLFSEVGLYNAKSNPTYLHINKNKEEIINDNIKFCEKFGLNATDKEKSLPIMYWLPKMHKNPIGARFIVASNQCSTKPLTKVVSKIFKMIFTHVENFHKKTLFYSNFKKFWVVQNSFPIVEKLDRINSRKNAKSISTFDFSTLYTTIPHNKLIDVLSEIIEFVFKSNIRNRIGFSPSSVYWTSKGVDKRYFTKQRLIEAISFLITKCYFTIGNLVFKQDIGIPMGIDPAPFWANLFLYYFESKFIQQLISQGSSRAYKYNATGRFIDDLCAINDGGDFSSSFNKIYPQDLSLKVEHEGTHATFLDLDITIKDGIFVYKLFDKRDKFPFFIIRMPHLSSNIPSSIFYGSVFSEFLRIARCTLIFEDFIPRASELYSRMRSQGGDSRSILKQIKKALLRYPDVFKKYGKIYEEIVECIHQYPTPTQTKNP